MNSSMLGEFKFGTSTPGSTIDAMSLDMLPKRMVFQRNARNDRTAGGLYKPDSMREADVVGTIVKCNDCDSKWAEADVVLRPAAVVEPINPAGSQLIIHERDIMANITGCSEMDQVEALGDYVLLKMEPTITHTKGGLELANPVFSSVGNVCGRNSAVRKDGISFHAGSRVIIDGQCGVIVEGALGRIPCGDSTYRFVNKESIVAYVEE